MNIGEFFVTLGVDAETTKLKDFVKGIGDLPIRAAAAIGELAGISFELTRIAQESMNAAVGFQLFTSQTGLSAQDLQRWQIVAEQANVSASSVAGSVTNLQRQLAEIRLGRGNIAPFQLLGISANQDAFRVLDQLREKIKGLDAATATNIIAQMGLSPDMIQVLRLTDKEFSKFSQTIRGMTEKQEATFLKSKLALKQFGMVVQENVMSSLANLISGFGVLVDRLGQFNGLLPAIAAGLAVVGAYFFPITAVIIALYLVLEDLAVYFLGGKSLTGLAVEGLKRLADLDFSKVTRSLQGLVAVWQKAGVMGKAVGLAGAGFLAAPLALAAPALGAGAATKIFNQTFNTNVSSSAPAHEVGKAVVDEQKRQMNAASLQTDNGGH